MPGRIDLDFGRPNAKQARCLRDQHKYICFGGARGGGKSWLVRTKAKLLAFKWPGIRILIIRRTYPELRENHIEPLKAETRGAARYNDGQKKMIFRNGSTILFGYLQHDSDIDRYQGIEYDVIFIDEATQIKEELLKKFLPCVRGVNGFPKRIYYTCNPGGVSHSYIKRLFIDREYREGESPEEYSFIQSLITDNAALMQAQPDYKKFLDALPPKLRAAWRDGQWDVFIGQFFEELRLRPDAQRCQEAGITAEEALASRRYTHVIPPIDPERGVPEGWRIFRSYDFGYNRPFSVGYWAMDYDGVLYRILELYGCTAEPNVGVQWHPEKQFAKMRALENQHPWLRGRKFEDSPADPAIWDASRGESIAETAARYGIYFTKGDNRRIAGWMQVHRRLAFDANGRAQMYIFDTCKAFIRTMPQMMYSETETEDLDTKLEDHVADEVRYMCMARPVAPPRPKQPEYRYTDPFGRGGF